MGKRIYQRKTDTTIKVRLQHTVPDDEISPLLEELADGIDKSLLCSFSRPRLGTNPKYAGNQATAMYLEIDFETLQEMFALLKVASLQAA
jgi:hypothetical protein